MANTAQSISESYGKLRELVSRIANGMMYSKDYSIGNVLKMLMGAAQWADREAMADHIQMLMDYYDGYQTEYIKTAIQKKYVGSQPLLTELTTYNVIKRGIKSISNVYSAQPERKLVKPDGTEIDSNDPQYKALAWLMNEMQYDSVMRKVNRMVNLVGTCVVKPGYVPQHGRWVLDTFTFNDLYVIPVPELPSEALAIAYNINPYEIMMPDSDQTGSSQRVWHWWTKENFAVVEGTKGDILSIGQNTESVNPYQVIPFVRFTAEPTGASYFATPGKELIHIQDDINVALTNYNYVLKMQGFSIPVMIGRTENKDGKIAISPGKPLIMKPGSRDEHEASFAWQTPSPNLQGYKDYVQTRLEQLAYYLFTSKNQLVSSAQPSSGYALKLENWELMTQRAEQVPIYEYNEQRLFQVMKKMWNIHQAANGTPSGLPKDCPYRNVRFADDIQLQVNIPAIDFPQSPEETLAHWAGLMERKLKTPVDYYTDVDGMEQAEAEKEYKRVKEWFATNGEQFEPSKFGDVPKGGNDKAVEMPDKLMNSDSESDTEDGEE